MRGVRRGASQPVSTRSYLSQGPPGRVTQRRCPPIRFGIGGPAGAAAGFHAAAAWAPSSIHEATCGSNCGQKGPKGPRITSWQV
mmetsp:Transcript_35655/g.58621  ORF Transcript_35655/g.58621 Transcript_35655/m.58621 type:complete len:84 (-) Transcript_35655:679-930(-)